MDLKELNQIKMKFEPYNLESFKKLLNYAYNLGWYTKKRNLFTLKCDGEFEGFYGRASETWEQEFSLISEEIELDNGVILPALNIKGKTIKEICDKALTILEL